MLLNIQYEHTILKGDLVGTSGGFPEPYGEYGLYQVEEALLNLTYVSTQMGSGMQVRSVKCKTEQNLEEMSTDTG